MSWLARLDAQAHRWPWPLFWTFRALAALLAVLGAYTWVGLWFERHPVLGIVQFVIVAILLRREIKAWPGSPAPPGTRQRPRAF